MLLHTLVEIVVIRQETPLRDCAFILNLIAESIRPVLLSHLVVHAHDQKCGRPLSTNGTRCPRASMRVRGLAGNCYRLSYSLREPEKQRREAAGRGN